MKTPEDYLNEVQEAHDKLKYSNSVFRLSTGKKYIKVIENSYGSDRVHCFIDADGNLYKAETWTRPAKGIRGNINNDKKPCNIYGVFSYNNHNQQHTIMEQRENDIQKLCTGVLTATPNIQYTHKGDYTQCPFCGIEVDHEEEDISKLPHRPDCAYLIAKDLSTGFNQK